MTVQIISTLSVLLLLAYVFDLTAARTKIPSVILLLLLGFLVKAVSANLSIEIPDLNPILPILGTIGLVLIVLEGSLELEINKSKLPLVLKTSLVAFAPLLIVSFGTAYYLHFYHNVPVKIALANAIPIGIISSAIAIPSANHLLKREKEVVTYESSLSDIFGVIFFNFITLNDNIGTQTFGRFALELLLMLTISLISTVLLAVFLSKIKHHIKFVPMIILVVLIYAVSKIFHLPALIFIMIFGLFLGNIDELSQYKFFKKFDPGKFNEEVHKFREITSELAFLIRVLFFMLFGFLIEIADVLNSETMLFAFGITLSIFIVRFFTLKIFRIAIDPLIFIAPRGLITILLFLSIPITQQIIQIDKSLITQVIILSALVMMFGLMRYKTPKEVP